MCARSAHCANHSGVSWFCLSEPRLEGSVVGGDGVPGVGSASAATLTLRIFAFGLVIVRVHYFFFFSLIVLALAGRLKKRFHLN